MHAASAWTRPDQIEIEDKQEYLVQTNGGEWRDVSLRMMPGIMLKHFMRPEVVRGKPLWIAKINPAPETTD